MSRPRILKAFGWRAMQVLSRDWFHDSQAVLDAIERALLRAPVVEEEPPLEEEPLPEPVEVQPPAAQPVPAPDAQTRRFECTEGGSRKFWQIGQQGTDVTVTFGRIGTQGQTQLKQFRNEQRAQQELQKLVGEKLKKGYVETSA